MENNNKQVLFFYNNIIKAEKDQSENILEQSAPPYPSSQRQAPSF